MIITTIIETLILVAILVFIMIKVINDINETTKDNAGDIKFRLNSIVSRLDEINNNIVLIHDQYKSVKNEIVKIKTINDKNVNTYKVVKANIAKINKNKPNNTNKAKVDNNKQDKAE